MACWCSEYSSSLDSSDSELPPAGRQRAGSRRLQGAGGGSGSGERRRREQHRTAAGLTLRHEGGGLREAIGVGKRAAPLGLGLQGRAAGRRWSGRAAVQGARKAADHSDQRSGAPARRAGPQARKRLQLGASTLTIVARLPSSTGGLVQTEDCAPRTNPRATCSGGRGGSQRGGSCAQVRRYGAQPLQGPRLPPDCSHQCPSALYSRHHTRLAARARRLAIASPARPTTFWRP